MKKLASFDCHLHINDVDYNFTLVDRSLGRNGSVGKTKNHEIIITRNESSVTSLESRRGDIWIERREGRPLDREIWVDGLIYLGCLDAIGHST